MPAADRTAPQPAEERSYLAFGAFALCFVLGAGLVLGILIGLGIGGDGLIDAHAWTQLHGWIGLFVAGMSLRLVPRLAGRRPFSRWVTLSILALLVSGVALRLIATWAGVLRVPAAVVFACGACELAAALGVALTSRGRPWQAWRLAAWAGAAWWLGWAALDVAASLRALNGQPEEPLESAADWVGVLGALSNFVWAVQSRSVPVFYGRRSPDTVRLAPPAILLNTGVALVFASAFGLPTAGAGFVLAGAATIWLATLAGSVWGAAHRLRPVSRPAGRFIVAANLFAVGGGALLLAAGARQIADGSAGVLRDAALHLFGLGFMTMLIVGMAQLLMPAFAGERVGAVRMRPESWLSWPALIAATVLRVIGSALDGQAAAGVIAAAGVLAWVGIAAFAIGLARAVRAGRTSAS